MERLSDLLQSLEDAALSPGKTVSRSMSETGKKAVGCFPIFTPEELVYAAGMLPVGMWGGRSAAPEASRYLQSFCCSLMRANTAQALRGVYDQLSAVILTTYCDTLKCVTENWKAALAHPPLIPMVYPQNRRTEAARSYMREEWDRVLRRLEEIGGEPVSEERLSGAVELYDEYRGVMREFVSLAGRRGQAVSARSRHLVIKAGWFMDKAPYLRTVKAINQQLRRVDEDHGRKRVVLTGLICEPVELFDILDENGFSVAADDLAHESMQFRPTPEEAGRGSVDAFDRIASRITGMDGCSLLYDEGKSRGRQLIRMVRESGAEGVLAVQMKFCDPEEFDYPIYRRELEEAGIPLLRLEVEQQMDSLEQIRTRIQSFGEMLAGGGSPERR